MDSISYHKVDKKILAIKKSRESCLCNTEIHKLWQSGIFHHHCRAFFYVQYQIIFVYWPCTFFWPQTISKPVKSMLKASLVLHWNKVFSQQVTFSTLSHNENDFLKKRAEKPKPKLIIKTARGSWKICIFFKELQKKCQNQLLYAAKTSKTTQP